MAITLDFSVMTEFADLDSFSFIIKFEGTWDKQSEDTVINYANYQHCISGTTMTLWTIPGEGSKIEIYATEEETKLPKITTAKFIDFNTIECTCTIDVDELGNPIKYWAPKSWVLYAFDKSYQIQTDAGQKANKEYYAFKHGGPESNVFRIRFNYTARINVQYLIESVFEGYEDKPARKIVVSYENLYENANFNKYYNYSGKDLGATYTPEQTTFKVWSPVSALVDLNLYTVGYPKALGADGNDDHSTYHMNYTGGGVWEVTIKGDLAGKYYTYSVTHSAGTVETIDPYAKACGLNGIRGYVYDNNAAKPDGWDNVPKVWDNAGAKDIKTPQELSIYEVHIRDLTMDDTWQSNSNSLRGTYSAFVEEGTTYTENNNTVTTGFSHIKELGVKAVQLLPVFDNDNDERIGKRKFNWGYNPLNYNCVDGGYATDPINPTARIVEFKNLVQSFAKYDMRIIMDVVYNHVSSASASCFTKVMPKYYFRYNSDWSYADGSGCSNEVKSDAPMMRKYIVDSLCWWATEYKIKGFRFDLMALIDSLTLKEAKEALYAIDKDIVIYGEGWTSGGYHGRDEWIDMPGYDNNKFHVNGAHAGDGQGNEVYSQLYSNPGAGSYGQVGGFNNYFRDEYKGENDDGYNQIAYPKWGWVSKTSDVGSSSYAVERGLEGSNDRGPGDNPEQTINYLSCHDNYTLWDQLQFTLAGGYKNAAKEPTGKPSTESLVNASIAGHGAVMLGNGMAFIQGGEELYRTKSYTRYLTEEQLAKYYDKTSADALVRPYPDYPNSNWDDKSKQLDPNYEVKVGVRPDGAIATAEVWMYDEIISHNSYKSPDEVNSFKWDRKISVDNYNTYQHIDDWKAMVEARKHMTFKAYQGSDSDYNVWVNDNSHEGKTAIGIWTRIDATTGYAYIFANRSGGTFYWDLDVIEEVYKTGTVTHSGNKIVLKANACVCYRVRG